MGRLKPGLQRVWISRCFLLPTVRSLLPIAKAMDVAIEITIPRLGWSMEEGTFVEWLKKDGDAISPGMALFTLEGEKAVQEIEAVDAGILHIPAKGPQSGDVLPVGAVIAFLLSENESPSELPRRTPQPNTAAVNQPVTRPAIAPIAVGQQALADVAAAPSVRRLARELGVDWQSLGMTGTVSANDVRRAALQSFRLTSEVPRRNAEETLPRISPRAERTARLRGVDWTQLHGSGSSGRIREQDVLAAKSIRTLAPQPPNVPGRVVAASPIRKAIAERLQASAHDVVPVTLTTKLDASALVRERERLKADSPNVIPSYNDLIVYQVARLLTSEPTLNACWWNGGIYVYDAVNIAVAVDADMGLLTPVIERADVLSLLELAERTKQLAERARAGRLTQAQLSGGTFTVTNLGMFGIDGFTPVINPPQAAILGVGRIVDEPVVQNGQVVPGTTLTLSLTFDHRVIDGAPAARWLQQLAAALQ